MPLALDPAPFPFAGSAPDSPPLAVVDCVVEALPDHGAYTGVVRVGAQAYASCFLHLGVVVLVVAVEEISRQPPTLCGVQPLGMDAFVDGR